jgi:hypothetical protein
MAGARGRAGTGGPHRRRQRPESAPRDFLRCGHAADLATALARSMSSSLVVLVVDDDGLLVAGTEAAVTPGDVVEQCGRFLAATEPTGDAALLVSLDPGFGSEDEGVRRAWLDVRGRFAEAGIELLDWLLVAGDTYVSMAGLREPGS